MGCGWLPGTTPAHTAVLATAILGALAIGVPHAACRAWGARRCAATITVGIFAAAPLILQLHCEAKVFAIHGLVAAPVLCLTAANGPLRGAGGASQGEARQRCRVRSFRRAGSARRSRQRR